MDSLMFRRLTACAIFCVVPSITTSSAFAQGATNTVVLTPDFTPSSVRVGDYYSQVRLRIDSLTLPNDDKGQKQLGQAILAAFGLGDKIKSLSISAVLTRNGQALPEVPLVTYSFDGKKRLTNVEIINSYVSPRWSLGASDPISVTLNYKYSEQATYNPTSISDNVGKLIPSDAIVSTLSAPFVQGVAGLAASIFQTAGTRTVNVRNRDDLLPYSGAVGARALEYKLSLPNGQKLGSVSAVLVVSPTLLRTAILAPNASPADLKRGESESVTGLALDLAGAKRNLLQEVEGLAQFAAMAREPSSASIRTYCIKANAILAGYDLTRMDRTTVIYQSLLDAGFDPARFNPAANTWLGDCFADPVDRLALTNALDVSFTPPAAPPVPPSSPDKWPKVMKDAMGCWISGHSGPYCQQQAPNAPLILSKSMTDQVRIGVIELAGIDQTAIPVGRMWDKAMLIEALKGKAEGFSCYQLGLVLTNAGQPYILSVQLRDNLIAGLDIQRAGPEAAQCLAN